MLSFTAAQCCSGSPIHIFRARKNRDDEEQKGHTRRPQASIESQSNYLPLNLGAGDSSALQMMLLRNFDGNSLEHFRGSKRNNTYILWGSPSLV